MSLFNEYMEETKKYKYMPARTDDEILDILTKHVDGYGGPGPDYDDYVEFLDYFLSYVSDDIRDFIQHLKEEGEEENKMKIDNLTKMLKTQLATFSINY